MTQEEKEQAEWDDTLLKLRWLVKHYKLSPYQAFRRIIHHVYVMEKDLDDYLNSSNQM